jgi:hypothetical protein
MLWGAEIIHDNNSNLHSSLHHLHVEAYFDALLVLLGLVMPCYAPVQFLFFAWELLFVGFG